MVYGFVGGDALPTATVFRLIPASGLIAVLIPFAPLAILAYAVAGGALAWSAWFEFVSANQIRELEHAHIRLWRVFLKNDLVYIGEKPS